MANYLSGNGGQLTAQDAILQEAERRLGVALNQRLAMGPEHAAGLDQALRILAQLRREVQYVAGQPAEPCGCNLEAGRCDEHRRMMELIHEVWSYGTDSATEALYAAQDGYGETGLIPAQGYDWSGIRDSSIEAVEAMHLIAEGIRDREGQRQQEAKVY